MFIFFLSQGLKVVYSLLWFLFLLNLVLFPPHGPGSGPGPGPGPGLGPIPPSHCSSSSPSLNLFLPHGLCLCPKPNNESLLVSFIIDSFVAFLQFLQKHQIFLPQIFLNIRLLFQMNLYNGLP